MRLAASSAPVAMKRRAVDPVYTVKTFPIIVCFTSYEAWVKTNLKNHVQQCRHCGADGEWSISHQVKWYKTKTTVTGR
jgi:hypothetical protein